ncbi:oligosaccharide flippase family protein [Halioglobus sp. Uisw_031]|uniref:oligosaccharide flippase family protein n=1 Tax=Halioglobus sp. Uisw_031 TaxID=3230977 RepID=UPI0039EBC794
MSKNLVVILSTLILLPLIIREIGMNVYGLVTMPMIFGGLVVVADFGISKSITFRLGRRQRDSEIGEIISSGLVINGAILFILGIIIAVAIFLNVQPFGSKLNITQALSNQIVLTGYLVFAATLMNNFLTAIMGAFYLQHYVNVGFAISSVSLNLSIYAFCLLTDSVELIILAPLVAYLVVGSYYMYVVKTRTDARLGATSKSDLLNAVLISVGFFKISMVSSIVLPANKYLLIFLSGSPTALAIFDLSLKIAQMASSMLNTISQPLFAVFSSSALEKGKVYFYAIRVSGIIFLGYVIGLSAYFYIGPEIAKYVSAESAVSIYKLSFTLIFGLGGYACAEPVYQAMLGRGQLKIALQLKLLIPLFNILILALIYSENTLTSIVYSYAAAVFSAGVVAILYFLTYFLRGHSKAI